MRLYVIRHGESENNLKKCWTGWMDVSLTEKGIEDAKKAGEILRGITFDKIYSSDLTRAVQTAKNAIPGCTPETTPLLREVNVGSIAGKPITSVQVDRTKKDVYAEFGGETDAQFRQRIEAFFNGAEALDCDSVAAFAHAGWLRGALDRVVGIRLPRDRVCCNNCTVAVFEYDNKNWRLHSWINIS